MDELDSRIVLSLGSGGVLGIAHIGAYLSLINAGLSNRIDNVWGSSIGALIGLAVALNFDQYESLEFLVKKLDLTQFDDLAFPKKSEFFSLPPKEGHSRLEAQIQTFFYHPARFLFKYAVAMSKAKNQLGECKGEYIQQLIENAIEFAIQKKYKHQLLNAIEKAFDDTKIQAILLSDKLSYDVSFKEKKLSDQEKKQLVTNLLSKLKKILNKEEPLTFEALHQFRLLEPTLHLKDLHVTATDISVRPMKLAVFSYEKTPQMPIKTAIHCSMAFPKKYAPVEYNNHFYLDGVLLCNTPYEIIKKSNSTKNAAIICVACGKSPDVEGKSKPISGIVDLSSRLFFSPLAAQETNRSAEDYNHFVHIDIRGISAFDFNTSLQTQLDLLIPAGFDAMEKFLVEKEFVPKKTALSCS